jgi:hypothetical protein
MIEALRWLIAVLGQQGGWRLAGWHGVPGADGGGATGGALDHAVAAAACLVKHLDYLNNLNNPVSCDAGAAWAAVAGSGDGPTDGRGRRWQVSHMGAGGDHGTGKIQRRREVSVGYYYDQSNYLHPHP